MTFHSQGDWTGSLAAFLGNLEDFLDATFISVLSLTFSGMQTQETWVLDLRRGAEEERGKYEDAFPITLTRIAWSFRNFSKNK